VRVLGEDFFLGLSGLPAKGPQRALWWKKVLFLKQRGKERGNALNRVGGWS
jgi:hypothetical protein